MNRLFLGLLVLALALGIAGFWFWQRNTYSRELLKLEVIAPSQATLGEEVVYTVRWKNNAEVRLENPVLFFEYPKGSIPSGQGSQRITQELKEIYPGQEQVRQFRARLFGKEGEVKEAKALLVYTPKNLQARFEAETKGTTVISFVPLSFELDLPSRTESDQQFSFTLNYFSNTEYPLADLRAKIEYPEGFTFTQASPKPLGENEWKLGLLNKTEGGRIFVRGKLQGQLEELKVFKATIGSWKEGEFTLLKEITKGVLITKPQLHISQLVNGNIPSFVSPGDLLHYEISFKNVSERNLENLFLIVSLEGLAFDTETIRADQGTFQPGDKSLVFEARNVPRLRFLGRGEIGMVDFWVRVREQIDGFDPQGKNLVLRNKVLLSEAKEEFELKVNSRLALDQKGYYQDEVFGNEGPLPPRAGSRTTYTVIWQAQNFFNDAKNVRVKAILPQEVELTGKVFPESASLTFDSQSRELVWTVGDLLAGTGTFTNPVSVAFQIAATPTVSERGNPVLLIGEARIEGEDTWTVQTIAGSAPALNTTVLGDPSFTPSQGIVQ